MKRMISSALFAVLMLGISLQSCSNSDQGKTAQSKAGNTLANAQTVEASSYPEAPNFILTNQDGEKVNLGDYKGKVVILDFWATWCGPCRMGIPGFVKLREKYHEKGFEIIGISLDRPGWQVVKPFMDEYKINYPIVLANNEVVANYGGVNSIPTTFVVNKDGKVVDRVIGYRPDTYFEQEINKWLNL